MMTSQQILNYVAAEPFRPFRISMASGRTFDIRHPEMVKIGRTTVTIYTALSDDPDTAREREHEVSVILVESLEPLESRTAAGKSTAS
ncbi:MAG: hypothetical protein KF774_08510 [Planctomyces sp.]|nr:hypothetical protein [Planctomyces sp.]